HKRPRSSWAGFSLGFRPYQRATRFIRKLDAHRKIDVQTYYLDHAIFAYPPLIKNLTVSMNGHRHGAEKQINKKPPAFKGWRLSLAVPLPYKRLREGISYMYM
ncbi:MAG: hypothetical protein KKB26_16305, partial [Gammaproteobacteria bacterium]|nr:hypothetical protein [Gammaproteobacteria bacterium]